MQKKNLKIGIIGAGAIGGVMSTLLSYHGYDVEMTKRLDNEFVVIDNLACMEVTGVFGNVSCLVPYVKNNDFTSPKDIIFLCTSAYNLDWCMQKALDQLKPNGVIVALQNVWSLDELMGTIPRNKLMLLYNDWNSIRISGRSMHVFDDGEMHLGALTNKLDMPIQDVAKILSCITTVVIERDFVNFLMNRFILDSTLLCMGAITGRSIGGFLSTKQGKNIFIHLIDEQVTVAKARGMKIDSFMGKFDYNLFVEKTLKGLFYRATMFRRLIMRNGNVVSRILRRLENNKKTEADYLLHQMCLMGDKVGVDTPYTDAADKILHEITAKERSICMDNMQDPLFKSL